MNLPAPSSGYSQANEAALRRALEQEDRRNRKVGVDVDIGSERLVLKSPDGTRFQRHGEQCRHIERDRPLTDAQRGVRRCRAWIRAAVEPTGLYTIEDVEEAIAEGRMQFWPGRNCAAVTEFVIYPNCKALNVLRVGGGRVGRLRELTREIEPALVRWAAASDCRKIIGFGINPAWRPVCEGMGYAHL